MLLCCEVVSTPPSSSPCLPGSSPPPARGSEGKAAGRISEGDSEGRTSHFGGIPLKWPHEMKQIERKLTGNRGATAPGKGELTASYERLRLARERGINCVIRETEISQNGDAPIPVYQGPSGFKQNKCQTTAETQLKFQPRKRHSPSRRLGGLGIIPGTKRSLVLFPVGVRTRRNRSMFLSLTF